MSNSTSVLVSERYAKLNVGESVTVSSNAFYVNIYGERHVSSAAGIRTMIESEIDMQGNVMVSIGSGGFDDVHVSCLTVESVAA